MPIALSLPARNKQGMAPLVFHLVFMAAGGVAVFAGMRPGLAARDAEIATLRARLEAAGSADEQLADLRGRTASLRHDLRGILSPALLTADRLADSQDPAIRKAADILIRTVDRATARLAETTPPAQSAAKSPGA
jgi:hypothetical protein